jgi:hypothetical protein
VVSRIVLQQVSHQQQTNRSKTPRQLWSNPLELGQRTVKT